ncbi:7-carboxy-7-deazaguanine synthase QueE [Marinilongibacter aquaticus]|uniref:7-carboxy-7-deazaguanine synthase QueE n=1 Tax=Marinilongibacter aquaticus TaxID=2975157 RepID=UPI0021BD0534|nr:7-carboxy-7-deazaguanine synthase QueE [Marinilongibacter aquaticus]UBM59125.1 7-carboxy-7-deazaguanine synthase QueE [Marinilongibacter aquaticus]
MNDTVKISSKLPLMEAFYTLQGEGVHTGKAAYFIRLGGCDVGCVWCDVKESWEADAHPQVEIAEIVKGAEAYPGRLAVITGGEPLMYDLTALTARLKQAGFQTNIETSGAHPLSGEWDWICLSPKKFKAPLPEVYAHADELKVIVYNKSDFKYAEENAAKVGKKCQLLLQPEWSRQEQMLPLIIDYIKANPQWKVSLQTHKWMDIP